MDASRDGYVTYCVGMKGEEECVPFRLQADYTIGSTPYVPASMEFYIAGLRQEIQGALEFEDTIAGDE